MGALDEVVGKPAHEAPDEDAEDEDDREERPQAVTHRTGELGARWLGKPVRRLRAAAVELRLEDLEEGLVGLVARTLADAPSRYQPVRDSGGGDAPSPEGSRVAHPLGGAQTGAHSRWAVT